MKKLIFLSLLCLAFSASAGLVLEPYLGYTVIGSLEDNDDAETKYDFNSPLFGARVGYSKLGFIAGLQYDMMSGYDLEADWSGGTNANDCDSSYLGAFVGYKFPAMLRVWGSYFLKSKIEYSSTELEGNGFALGVGFKPIPLPIPAIDLFFNLEYRMLNYDEMTTGSTTTKIDYDAKMVVVTASLPISF